jgi:RecB family endonuclease NucS
MDYKEKIERALASDETIIIGAGCSVSYSGRAESFLPPGDRIIIIKSDKSLIVHQPKGTAPVNYMKNGSVHILEEKGKNILLKSKNSAQKEFMDIELEHIHFVHCQKFDDDKEIELQGTEKHMSDMIIKNPELIEKEFKPLSREEHTKYGFIDVFGHDHKNNLVVIECKRFNGDLSAVTQLRRYVEKIKELKGIKNVRGILACPSISSNALKMLEDWGFEHRKIEPPKHLERHKKSQKALHEF